MAPSTDYRVYSSHDVVGVGFVSSLSLNSRFVQSKGGPSQRKAGLDVKVYAAEAILVRPTYKAEVLCA